MVSIPVAASITLVDLASGRLLYGTIECRSEPEVNHVAADPDHDYAAGAFDATVPLPAGTAGEDWDVRLSLRVGDREWTGPLTTIFRRGTAGWIPRRVLDGGLQVVPTWVANRGLVLRVVRRPVTARSSAIEDLRWKVEADVSGTRPTTVHLVGPAGAELPGEVGDVRKEAGVWHAVFRFPLPAPGSGDWQPHVGGGGGARPVYWAQPDDPPPAPEVTLAVLPSGRIRLSNPEDEVVVEHVDVSAQDPLSVHLRGRAPSQCRAFTLTLRGPRSSATAQVEADDGRFETLVPLRAASSPWSTEALPLPIGTYDAGAVGPLGEALHVRLTPEAVERTCGRWTFGDDVLVRPERGVRSRLEVRLAPPRAPEEWSELGQRREDSAYRARVYEPEEAVFFESFLGKRASCNPLAIRNGLARRRPDLRRIWGVFENSVPVPPGDEKVVIGTRAWRDARGSARYVVTNDWLRRFEHRPFQTFVQTWHGTPLKKLALDRRPRGLDPTYQKLVREEASHWDYLVSQNPFMTAALRTAYDYTGPVLEVGYPRNDILTGATTAVRRRHVRERLGLAEHSTVILYAPTWREDNERRMPTPPDPEVLRTRLGPSLTLLVRGHAENIRNDRRLDGTGLLDVTLYPDVSDLFLVADALVTDYSSLMFDFAVTGRPIVFFAPDLEDHRTISRGHYFDLEEVAPGPVVHSSTEVAAALADLPALRSSYHDAYRSWREKFVPFDDGDATSRVIDAVWSDRVEP